LHLRGRRAQFPLHVHLSPLGVNADALTASTRTSYAISRSRSSGSGC